MQPSRTKCLKTCCIIINIETPNSSSQQKLSILSDVMFIAGLCDIFLDPRTQMVVEIIEHPELSDQNTKQSAVINSTSLAVDDWVSKNEI